MTIAGNLAEVRERIAQACGTAGVPTESVTLIAVSKTQPAEAIREAYAAGQRQFGENRVQEWREKSSELPGDIEWNLIGRLQTNKVKYIIGQNIALLQSLDRVELARDLQKRCENDDTRLDVLVELNLSRELSKSGVYAEDVDRFVDEVSAFDRLTLRGLMTIGPNTNEEGRIRQVFSEARVIYDRLLPSLPSFRYLSMGMSQDYELAILEGSNMVRVGTSIFGERHYGTP